jgi:isopentenyldiphosphate isomerase
MDEMLDIVDERGGAVGCASRSAAHRLGLWHVIFHAWIVSDEPIPNVLLQRRAVTTELNPGLWDISVAGHYAAGERGLDGLREVTEELGYTPDVDRIENVGRFRLECSSGRLRTNELCDVYLIRDSPALEACSPSVTEVSQIGYVSLADLGTVLTDPTRRTAVRSMEYTSAGSVGRTDWIDASSFGTCKAAMLAQVYTRVAQLVVPDSGPATP